MPISMYFSVFNRVVFTKLAEKGNNILEMSDNEKLMQLNCNLTVRNCQSLQKRSGIRGS